MTDLDDMRRSHPDHEGCTNGFIYTKLGCITALFTGNSKRKNPEEMGFYDGSTVQVTFPRTYDETHQPIYVAPFDRFYLDEESLVVPMWQLFLHHETGTDRLKYPVEKILHLIDSSGLRYQESTDFIVSGGLIKWIGRRPTPSLDLGPLTTSAPILEGNPVQSDRGAVCSARYLYRPYWYVGQVMHELRVTQTTEQDGRNIRKMPQAVVLHREYVALTRDKQEPGSLGIDADALRTVLGPLSGGFGPK
jgi:hypothetical protein